MLDWFAKFGFYFASMRGRSSRPVDFPIAVLSFDRPGYLKPVLASLRRQIDASTTVILFQDGSRNLNSGRVKGDPARIAECVSIFRAIIPWGEVRQAENNLGIAWNYEGAERYMFEELKVEQALFLEDDMVLSHNYLDVIGQLLDFARSDDRIAYVSAYGSFWANLREQKRRAAELIPMHENWGAAMTRRSWLAERPFRKAYLALVEGSDYSRRDHDAIRAFYAARGWVNKISSQDAARWIASVERGAVRVTSFVCNARYIGAQGEHSTPELYKAGGFSRSVPFRGSPPVLRPPAEAEINRWLATERARFTSAGQAFYSGHGES